MRFAVTLCVPAFDMIDRIYSTVQKAARYISLFVTTILGQLVFNIASGALCLYLLFRVGPNDPDQVYNKCMDVVAAHPNDLFLRNLCQRSPLMKGLSVGLYVFMWLTEISKSLCWYGDASSSLMNEQQLRSLFRINT